jgi:hypothetical protein
MGTLVAGQGCAISVDVMPLASDVPRDYWLAGPVEYDGNSLYMPKTVRSIEGVASETGIEIRYSYDVKYSEGGMHELIVLYNLLALFGSPSASECQSNRHQIGRGS